MKKTFLLLRDYSYLYRALFMPLQFVFSPVTVEILSNQSASSISLYNQSNESTDLQVRVFEWSQNNGQDQLTPTDEIAVSPPFLKLQPNDSYNLRVVRVNPTPVSGEKPIVLLLMSCQNLWIAAKLVKV